MPPHSGRGHRSLRCRVRPHLLPLPCWPVAELGTAMWTQSQESWDRQRKTHSCPQIAAPKTVRGMRLQVRQAVEGVALLLPRQREKQGRLLQHR
jgi:hypothetical protein